MHGTVCTQAAFSIDLALLGRALLLLAALDVDDDGLGRGLSLVRGLLLAHRFIGDQLLNETETGGKRPVQKNTGGGDEAHPKEHEAHDDEHHHGLALVVGVLLQLQGHRCDRHGDEEKEEDDVGKGVGDATDTVRVAHGLGKVRQDVVETHIEAGTGVIADLPAQHLEEDDEDGHLNQHGQAACQRVEAGFAVDLHRLLGKTLLITGVKLLDLLEAGLYFLHLEARFELLALQGEQNRADDQGDDDDGEAPVANEQCELV